jgi:inorganic pyrophosphatase
MTPKTARHKILSEIAPFDEKSDDLRIVIETPKGSRNKYSYDPDCDCMQLSTVLPEGLVLPGCVVRTRVIGGIEAKQKEKGENWTKNDRLIAVATHAQTYQKAKTLSDLRPHLVEEIIEFFVDYNKLRNRKFKAGTVVGPHKAKELIDAGMKQFRHKHNSK